MSSSRVATAERGKVSTATQELQDLLTLSRERALESSAGIKRYGY